MIVEVSIGEAIDKLSILEIKLKKIADENKQIEIQKEINALQECHQYKSYDLYYKLLMYVNEKIWDMTDVIKSITIENPNFAYLSNKIFEFNQKRFRVKNWYNLIACSNIKEQKSYSLSQCNIFIKDENTFYNKIPEIIFLALEYDRINIVSNFNDKISNILKIPTIIFSDECEDTKEESIHIERFEIDKENISVFEFKPVVYVSGGFLGDFIQQLSVINETFLSTGRKGILYIANIGENFRFSLSKTYEDTYKLISEQVYIKSYKIFNNEEYDVNLSNWRNTDLSTSWSNIFKNTYNVNWGTNKWITVPCDNSWKDIILISTNSYRQVHNINFIEIIRWYRKSVKFIDFSETETIIFKNILKEHNLENELEFYKPTDIYELCTAINSCKVFIGNLSSPLAFAYAMHKKTVVGLKPGCVDGSRHLGLENIIKNIFVNMESEETMAEIKLLCDCKQ